MKVFVFDADRCNGCYNCQFACKDEHCNNDWSPYAKEQPDAGQFWLKLNEKVRGQVPKVRGSWIPFIGAQDEAVREYAPEVIQEREDGIIVIDPEKAQGREDIADKFEGIYWNAELKIPQGCTGCAHLLDDGWTVPRCVDACPMDNALRFGDEEDFADELKNATKLSEGSHVYYLNYPKRFVAGCVIDPEQDEVIIGATVTLENVGNGEVMTTETDDFGDFWFKQIEPGKYNLYFEADGYMTRMAETDCAAEDKNVGDIEMFAGGEDE